MSDDKPDDTATFVRRDTPDETLDQALDAPDVRPLLPSRDEPGPSERRPAAIHGSELWGGPRFITNAQNDPIFIETKQQYWDLLKRTGMRMQDQQESTTGDGPVGPTRIPIHQTPHPPIPALRLYEAEVFGAITAVFRRYGLAETLWCNDCFARHMPHGCRMVVSSRVVHLECRGGTAQWTTPAGETNLVLRTIANTTITRAEQRPGTIRTLEGEVSRPARLLLPQEMDIIRAYFRVLEARNLEARWHHTDCWSGNPLFEDDQMALAITDDSFIAVCQCSQLFYRREGGLQVTH